MLWELTFRDLNALDRFIPHSPSTLLDEFVSLEADVENSSTLNAERKDLLYGVVDYVRGQLYSMKTIKSQRWHERAQTIP